MGAAVRVGADTGVNAGIGIDVGVDVGVSLLEGVSCGLAKDLGRVVLASSHHLTLPEQLNRRPVRGPLVYPILKYLDVVSFDFGSHYHLTRHIKSLCNRLTQLYLLHVRALPNHS